MGIWEYKNGNMGIWEYKYTGGWGVAHLKGDKKTKTLYTLYTLYKRLEEIRH
jgi:hypothetical protein